MSVGDGTFACALCSFNMTRRLHVRNHVESKHFPNTFTYPCPICDKEFGTNKAFSNHKNLEHKWFALVEIYEIKIILHIFYSPSQLSLLPSVYLNSLIYFSCPCHPQARYTKHPPSYLTRHFRSYEAALLSANEKSDGRVKANHRRGQIMRTWVKWHMRHEQRARAHNTLSPDEWWAQYGTILQPPHNTHLMNEPRTPDDLPGTSFHTQGNKCLLK